MLFRFIYYFFKFFSNFSWSFEKLDAEKFVIDTTSKAKSIVLDKDKNLKNKKELVENLAIRSCGRGWPRKILYR